MNISTRPDNPTPARRRLRALHRWLGIASALFVLLLATTGIALNHSHDWRFDQRYVNWPWLLDAYGIEAPPLQASYADGEHRVTLLGEHLFFDGRLVADDIGQLKGFVALDPMMLALTADEMVLMTSAGELVERFDPGSGLNGEIERVGKWSGRVVIASDGQYLLSDAEVTGFLPSNEVAENGIEWSVASAPPAVETARLQQQFRGRGLTIERLLADLHSGRIIRTGGPLLMDLVGVFLIVLSVTGLLLWLRRGRRSVTRS